MSISGISGMDSYYYLSQLFRQSSSSSSSSSSSLSDLFASIDTNGDGSISKSELATALDNQDGGLTNSVMGSQTDSASLVSLLQDAAQLDSATGTTASMDQLFGKIDTNGDGSISKSGARDVCIDCGDPVREHCFRLGYVRCRSALRRNRYERGRLHQRKRASRRSHRRRSPPCRLPHRPTRRHPWTACFRAWTAVRVRAPGARRPPPRVQAQLRQPPRLRIRRTRRALSWPS